MGLSRRGFIGGSAAFVAAVHSGEALAAAGSPDLVDVTGTDPKAMVAAALKELGGIGAFVRPGDYVVLKPNAAFANPAVWATTTHPGTVAAVVKACLDAKAKQVLILEFPQGKAGKCLERCGLVAALDGLAVKTKLLSDASDFQKVDVPGGVALKSVEIAKALRSADVFINLPTAKHHTQAGVSFGLKNHMGLIWDRQVFHDQLDLQQAVADLARVIKPNLTLLDGTRALLTNGPAGPGETSAPGRIIAGRNVVSVDAYGLTLAKFGGKDLTPADVRHLALAGAAGLGEVNISKLKVKKLTV
jgi:uncharacterized protein (DUF362 family)